MTVKSQDSITWDAIETAFHSLDLSLHQLKMVDHFLLQLKEDLPSLSSCEVIAEIVAITSLVSRLGEASAGIEQTSDVMDLRHRAQFAPRSEEH